METVATLIPHTIMQLYLLVLAALIGFEVIAKVPVLLHTPLMSGSNAISGIVLVGAITLTCNAQSQLGQVLAYTAVFLATINVVGGFVVTDRMLAMFRSKSRSTPPEMASEQQVPAPKNVSVHTQGA